MGSKVSLPTGRTSFSVISAKARAALRCKSTLSEKDKVVSADNGEPLKKLVVVRSVPQSCRERERLMVQGSKNTHFLGTEEDLPQLLVRFRVAMVHRIATCALGLRHL